MTDLLPEPTYPASATPALTKVARALLILFAIGASIGLGLGFLQLGAGIDNFVANNDLSFGRRRGLLKGAALAGALFMALPVAFMWWRRRAAFADALVHLAYRWAPLAVFGFLPLVFNWRLWNERELQFLVLVILVALAVTAAFRAAFSVGPGPLETRLHQRVSLVISRLTKLHPAFMRHLPLLLVCFGALGYAIYFSFHTIAWHRAVRSGYDLAIENNIVWNLLHGSRPLFKSSPVFGPTFTHFGHHATLFALVIAPFYALYQKPETLLIVQSVLMGGAAIPLFLLARRALSQPLACCLALLYLLYPPLHGANLFEFHYIPLGTVFLWTTLYLLETRRDRWAVLAGLLTLSIREDVAASLAVIGAYLLLSGKRPRAGLVVMVISVIYFVTLKMVIMPRIAAGETFTVIYQGLLPEGENSFGSVLKTVFSNPAFTWSTLIEKGKLVYLLQILVPLAFLPLKRPMTALFMVPGILFTLLSTGYSATISIHYQYTAHWTSFLFVGLVLALSQLEPLRRKAAVAGLIAAMVISSFQFGSVMQRNNSWGGPIPYKFGVTDEDRQRRASMDALMADLPPGFSVASSAFVVPQLSSRENDYSMTNGVYEADYLAFPSEPGDFIVDELQTVTGLLSSNTFGVVGIYPPFALARRGHSTARNAELLQSLQH